jgi:hypothetical protein
MNEAIGLVCDRLRLDVIYDVGEHHGQENNSRVRSVVCLGVVGRTPDEPTTYVTPWLSPEELEAFCARHLRRFLACTHDAIPDASGWDDE